MQTHVAEIMGMRSPRLDPLDLAHKAFQSNNEPAISIIRLERIQFLFNLAVVLQKLIHSRSDNR